MLAYYINESGGDSARLVAGRAGSLDGGWSSLSAACRSFPGRHGPGVAAQPTALAYFYRVTILSWHDRDRCRRITAGALWLPLAAMIPC